MYPHRELSELGARKAALRIEIARLRAECVTAATGATRPLVWADNAVAFVRRLSPLALIAALPLGAIARGMLVSRFKFLGPVVRWAPLVFTAVRGLRAR